MTVPLYLPFYEQPHWDIPLPIVGELSIHAFGVLVAFALVFGTWIARWHGGKVGQSPIHVVDCVTWTAIVGFVVAHIVSVVFYFPERLLEDPLQILYIWNGLSSFGGFIGGVIGCLMFLRKRGLPILPYVDTLAVGLSAGWVLGRLGCTVAHDHPGRTTDFFLAFDHPTRGPIHDLGFYEFLFALLLFALIMFVRRLKWPPGAIPALMCLVYAPVRFFFDFLRIQDAKYLYFTPGQWLAVALFIFGVILMRFAFTTSKSIYGDIYARGKIDEEARKGIYRRSVAEGVGTEPHTEGEQGEFLEDPGDAGAEKPSDESASQARPPAEQGQGERPHQRPRSKKGGKPQR